MNKINKKILFLFLSLLFITSCKKESTINQKLINKDRKNYNDIQKALKDDPNNDNADKNQNPNDYKKDEKKDDKIEEFNKNEGIQNSKDKITKEQLKEKRDSDSKDGIINISDGIFLPLVNDIYLNKEEYQGKKIRIIGQVVKFEDKQIDEVIYAILREGPGCCYNDSVIGFEFIMDKGKDFPQPQKWYEMLAEVIIDMENSGKVVKLKALDYKEVEPRGKIFHFGG